MTTQHDPDDVLEQNVSTLLESGGEAPKLTDIARARIRAQLIATHGVDAAAPPKSVSRGLRAVGLGLVAAAAAAVIVTRFVGDDAGDSPRTGEGQTLADGSNWTMSIAASCVN